MTTPTPIANGETELATLIAAAPVRTAANDDRRRRALTFADLPRIGRPGAVTSRTPIDRLGMERWELANGVTAIVRETNIEPGKVRLRVRFGGGRSGIDPSAPNLLWTGPAALLESGIGRFDQSALDQLVSGRQIGMAFSVDDNAFEIEAETRPEDLHDQLRLIAAKLSSPAWQAAPVQRARAGQLLSYDLLSANPMAVIENQLQGIIYASDRRWSPPSRAEIEALTPASFRAFWEPQLRQGPVEILIFGDTQGVDLSAMLRDTFGALPARTPVRTTAASADVRTLTPPAEPIRLVHNGEASQAAAVLAYPTGGGLADIRTARQLDVLAAVFNDRLFERLRDQSGASYSQAVSSNWSLAFPHGGYLFVGGLLRPQDEALMFRLGREIAAELATTPVTPDELQRARSPLVEQVLRAASGNVFFMYQLEGASRDPAVISALTSYVGDLSATSPADIQRLAQTYLTPERAIPVLVLPESIAARTAPPAAAPAVR
jgi:zinc protease